MRIDRGRISNRPLKPIISALILCTTAALAQNSLPEPTGRVNDFANVMDSASREKTEAVISDLETRTSAEMAIVTIKSLDGESVEEYANRLFNKWGIGKSKKNNGVLLLVAVDDRKLRIEVGYGLEGAVPDGFAGDVIRNTIVPYFKAGRFGDGIYAGALRLAHRIEEDAGVAPTDLTAPPLDDAESQPPARRIPFFPFFLMPISFFALITAVLARAYRLIMKCPRCGKRLNVRFQTVREATKSRMGLRVRERTCPVCGFHDRETYVIPKRNSGAVWGSSGGYSRGGGGFSSSGGFGGGSSGGGGASGSW